MHTPAYTRPQNNETADTFQNVYAPSPKKQNPENTPQTPNKARPGYYIIYFYPTVTSLSLVVHDGRRPLLSPPAVLLPESPLSLDHFVKPANRPSTFFSGLHVVSSSRTLLIPGWVSGKARQGKATPVPRNRGVKKTAQHKEEVANRNTEDRRTGGR